MHDNVNAAKVTAAIAGQLQSLQRQRNVILGSRNMQANRLQAIMAGTIGYASGLAEADRRAKFKEASELIDRINKGEPSPYANIVKVTSVGIDAFQMELDGLESAMERLVKQLPVYAWITHPDRRGFGALSLAKIVGECGDLALYANPGKVWKRMGLAPITSDGQSKMGSTWRFGKEGKLSAAEWEAAGYCPRRRSLAYLIGEGIVKQNKGTYRKRYDEKKEHFVANRPAWTTCQKCNGSGRVGKKKCETCDGEILKKRCHLSAMLVATKTLLRDLWIEWNKDKGITRDPNVVV